MLHALTIPSRAWHDQQCKQFPARFSSCSFATAKTPSVMRSVLTFDTKRVTLLAKNLRTKFAVGYPGVNLHPGPDVAHRPN
jgi:hypothetical protein